MDSDSLFNARYYVTQLAQAQTPAEYAEAWMEAQAYVFEQVVTPTLATKADLLAESCELESALNESRIELLQAMGELRDDLRAQATLMIDSIERLGIIVRIDS